MADHTNPFGVLTKMFEQFKVPDVDMSALVGSRKQTEMLTQAMQDIQAATRAGAADPGKHAEVARNAWLKAGEDIKDLAEILRKSQLEAAASLTKRANEYAAEIKQMLQRK